MLLPVVCVWFAVTASNAIAVYQSFENKIGNNLASALKVAKISQPISIDITSHYVVGKSHGVSKNCWDMLRKFPRLRGKDGVYRISVGSEFKSVYCDMSTDGGGWTAIQRRQDGSTDFYRTWRDYKHGFGLPSKNYWIGNDAIYELTKNKDQELRVELQRFNGDKAFAQYSTFYVGDEASKYKLTVSGYSGTAGDSLAIHNGMKFSTKDQDNDGNIKCAVTFHGAWWYINCHYSNLNGLYGHSGASGGQYATWYLWKNKYEALKQTMMMIRHKN